MGETGRCKLFMSGGLCSNRTSISVINFITLFQCLTDMVKQIDWTYLGTHYDNFNVKINVSYVRHVSTRLQRIPYNDHIF